MKKRFFAAAVVALMGGMLMFSPALAQQPDPLGLNYGQASGLGDQDVRTTASSLINTILGFLGIIALVLVFYAGFLWMTAGGNSEQVDKAKNILGAAIIGLIIILSSYAITRTITTEVIDATGGVNNNVPPPAP